MKKNTGWFKKGFTPWNKNKRMNLNLKEIGKEHIKGKSILDISKELGVSDKIIRLRLKENNMFIRSNTSHSKQTIDKIKNTMKEKGIQPKEKYVGEAWNKGRSLNYDVWNKDKVGLQKSNKKGKTYEELYGEEDSKRYKEIIKERRSRQIFPLKDTKIEVKIQKFLKELNIKFIPHYFISDIRHSYQCDFFIPSMNLVLETDGCYWHGCETCNKELNNKQRSQKAKDNKRNKELIGKEYKVIRLYEHEIKKMNLIDFKKRIYF